MSLEARANWSAMSDEQIMRFDAAVEHYAPSPQVLEALSVVHMLLTISGPQAVGKSEVMPLLSPWLTPLVSTTTRPKRHADERTYNWQPDTPEQYEQIIADIEAGKVVQAARGLGGFVYSNHPADYGHKTAVDIAPDEALKLGRYFARSRHVFLVASTEQYLARFFGERVEQIGALRAAESIDVSMRSLAKALPDERFLFVDNPDGELKQTKDTVLEIAYGYVDVEKEAYARQVGQTLLADLEEHAMSA